MIRIHPWNLSPAEAIVLQKELRGQIQLQNSFKTVRFIAGCDMAIDTLRNEGYAGVVVYRWPDLEVVEHHWAVKPLTFPYVPGLLSFREIPILLAAIQQLEHDPDIFFVDGQGIAHPRRLGIASHLGLLIDKPTIGCAKSRLYGRYQEPGLEKGSYNTLHAENGELLGTVLRSKTGCQPLFVSPGHLIDIYTSLKLTLACLDGFRVPKPTRLADAYVSAIRKEKSSYVIDCLGEKERDQSLTEESHSIAI